MPSTAPDRRRVTIAYLQVLLAGTLWGSTGPFSVTLYGLGIPAPSVALLRPAVGAIFLALFLALFRAPRGLASFRLDRREAAIFLGLGGAIVASFQLSYQLSTEAVGVPVTVALLYTAPAWVLGLSAIFLGERITTVRGALVLVSLAGVWLTVLGSSVGSVADSPGGSIAGGTGGQDALPAFRRLLWGCATGLGYALFTLYGKLAGRLRGALPPLFWGTVGGTIILAAFSAARSEPVIFPSDLAGWGIALLFGFLTMAAAPLLFFHALRTLDAARASIGATVEPLVAAALAAMLLDQTLSGVGWIGLLLLVAGVAGAYASAASMAGNRTGKERVASAPPPS